MKILIVLVFVSALCQDIFPPDQIIIDPPMIDDSCPYGHYFHPKGCLECLSTCPVCYEINFYDEQCPFCGDGFKYNSEKTFCEPCQKNKLFCEENEGDMIWGVSREYWIQDGRVVIMDGDVVEPCLNCHIKSETCPSPNGQTNRQFEGLCGKQNKQNLYFDYQKKNFFRTSFFGLSAEGFEITSCTFQNSVCVFDVNMRNARLEDCNITRNVSFYESSFNEASLKFSNFLKEIYFKNITFNAAYISGNKFIDNIYFHKVSFLKAEITSNTFSQNVQFHNCTFDEAFFAKNNLSGNVLFENCHFAKMTFENATFSNVRFQNCRFAESTWTNLTLLNVSINQSDFQFMAFEDVNLDMVTIQSSNFVEVSINQNESYIANTTTLNSHFQNITCNNCSNIKYEQNSSQWIENNMKSNFFNKNLPFDDDYFNYKCNSCDQRCSICMDSREHCLECAKGYVKEGWKCIKQNHIVFRFILIGQKLQKALLSNSVEMLRKTILEVNDKYKGKKQAVTMREVYDIGSGKYQYGGTLEQVEDQDMKELMKKLMEIKKVDNYDVVEVTFGVIPEHPPTFGVLKIVLISVAGVLLIAIILMCLRKRAAKKKDPTFEMYGEFKDESTSAKN